MLPDRPTKLVPPVLATMAAWCGCLILVGVVVYFFVQVIARLTFVALPVAIALLLTALLFPLTRSLRSAGMRPIYATWITMLVALAVLVGTGWLVGARASEEFPNLVQQVQATARSVQNWLITGPLHLKEAQITGYVDEIAALVNAQRTAITGTVLSAGAVAFEVLASIVLLLFVTFFLLKDGDRIWGWFLKAFGGVAPRVDRAGRAAWATLSHYVQGTVAVAAVHGVIMGIVLAGMGVPLWAPLAVLIFFASFIPIVGIFFAGTVATLVTLGARGLVLALIFLGILIVEQQLENHVLQPLIVGRALNFHPLAIILVLSIGGILAGIAGAAVAVPVAAVIYRALPELRHRPPSVPPPSSEEVSVDDGPPPDDDSAPRDDDTERGGEAVSGRGSEVASARGAERGGEVVSGRGAERGGEGGAGRTGDSDAGRTVEAESGRGGEGSGRGFSRVGKTATEDGGRVDTE
ncbi:AI-2E family transporter [Nonomuraea jiangxiensis]|uniref:Predicted PurR-regulated permease PerM n=1 Tax=Nonomuraea jiangxiensis TaxID=633440 RepID=A0A1G8BM71_9ACTN|nr:AI-2E family transporter [Nonomuraea jiangxiensis]SDH34325.1 Predicted PurR-regulated permease PerM [Nonomuraea jiangxiensis]